MSGGRAGDEARGPGLGPLQRQLAAVLTARDAGPAAGFPDGIVPGGSLDVGGAVEVYRRGYVARLSEQLGETYASVWRVLGDEAFFAACEAFLAGHPSTSYNLGDYGREFPAFLAGAPWSEGLPFLEELAAFELLVHDLFHAPAHEAVPVSRLASLGALDGVRMELGSAVRLRRCRHAVCDIYRHRNDEEAPALDFSRPQDVVVYKQGGEVRVREVDGGTFALLEALSAGLPVDVALARAVEADPSFASSAVAGAFEWIARCGLVSSIR